MAINFNTYHLMSNTLTLFFAGMTAFTFRGFFKALFAYWNGDNTARNYGFLSLNPMAHLDATTSCIFLAISLVLNFLVSDQTLIMISLLVTMMILSGRWVKSVPINKYNFLYGNSSHFWVAFSGILGNFILALLCLYLYKLPNHILFSPAVKMTWQRVSFGTAHLSCFLAVLHLLPFPPLEGYLMCEAIWPAASQRWRDMVAPWVPLIIFGFILLPFFNQFFGYLVEICFSLLNCLVFI